MTATTLSDVRGQERAVAQLRRAIAQDRVAHAYLFTGPVGVGKHTTALALAAALNCQTAPGEGCHQCASCHKIAEGLHPDVVTLAREGAAHIIPIQTIRSRVLAAVGMPPHEARARFYLIEEATSMQGAAANALLKTLEEPPARTHFVLGSAAMGALLPTIRSRCQVVAFSPLPVAMRAELAGDDGELARLAERAESLLRAAVGDADIHQVALEAHQEKGQVAAILGLVSARLHERATAAAHARELRQAARAAAQAQLVADAELAVAHHNAHGQLAVEDLLYRLRSVVP